MADKVAGYLEVGTNGKGEVVINYDSKTFDLDENRLGHIVFSANQARNLAATLTKKAAEAEVGLERMTIEKAERDWERTASALYVGMVDADVDDPNDYRDDYVLPYLARAIVSLRHPNTIGDLLDWETEPLQWIGLEAIVAEVEFPTEVDILEWSELLLVPERSSFDGNDIAKFISEYVETEKGEVTGK